MAEEIGWVDLGVRPDVNGPEFGREVERGIDGPLRTAGRNAGHTFGRTLGHAAVGVGLGVLGTGFAAFKFGADALGQADEAIKGQRLTRQLLDQTGHAANVTGASISRLTGNLEKKNAVDDDTIRQSANLLLTFKKVANEGKGMNAVFNRAVKATQDMAGIQGMGGAEGAAKQLGKALSDPVKGITALTRSGVTFTQQQKDQIAAYVKAGDTLSAQKVILKEVNSEFGGAAASQATALDHLKTNLGEVEEGIGRALYPTVQKFSHFLDEKGTPALNRFTTWLQDKGLPEFTDWLKREAIPDTEAFYRKVKPLAEEALPALGTGLKDARDFLKDAAPYATDLFKAFNSLPAGVKTALVGSIAAGGLAAKLRGPGGGGALSTVSGGLLGGARGTSPLNPVYVSSVGGVGGVGGGKGGGLAGGLSPALLLAPVEGQDDQTSRFTRLPQAIRAGQAQIAAMRDALDFQRASRADVRNHRQGTGNLDLLDHLAPATLTAHDGDARRLLLNPLDEADTKAKRLHKDVNKIIDGGTLRLDTRKAEANVAALSASVASLIAGAPNIFAGAQQAALQVNYHAPVTYTDDKEGRRRAQQQHYRSTTDGSRRGGIQ